MEKNNNNNTALKKKNEFFTFPFYGWQEKK
jgi:hypothetical protein